MPSSALELSFGSWIVLTPFVSIEDGTAAEIWVGSGGRVREVFSGGVQGTWIDGNVGYRLCTISLVYLPFIFPFVVELVAQIIGIQLSGGHAGPRCRSRLSTTSFHRSHGDQGISVGACRRHHLPTREAASPSAGVRFTSSRPILLRIGQFVLW